MMIRRAAGFTALVSFVAMIALLVVMIVQIARAPDIEQGEAIGLLTLEDRGFRGIMTVQPLAVMLDLGARWDVRPVRAMTYEALEDVPVAVIVLRRPLTITEAIDLDSWVRDGGRALILAEPGRGWAAPSESVNPHAQAVTMGLRLTTRPDGPMVLPGGGTLNLHSAGRWIKSTACTLRQDALLADCRPGEGRMILVGDTGLLDRAGRDMSGRSFAAATALVGRLIDALESDRPVPTSFSARDGEYARPQPSMTLVMAMGALFWIAVGALAIWVIMLNMSRPARARPSGPAKTVRDPDAPAGPARIVHRDDPEPAPPR